MPIKKVDKTTLKKADLFNIAEVRENRNEIIIGVKYTGREDPMTKQKLEDDAIVYRSYPKTRENVRLLQGFRVLNSVLPAGDAVPFDAALKSRDVIRREKLIERDQKRVAKIADKKKAKENRKPFNLVEFLFGDKNEIIDDKKKLKVSKPKKVKTKIHSSKPKTSVEKQKMSSGEEKDMRKMMDNMFSQKR